MEISSTAWMPAAGERVYATEDIIYDTPDFGGTVQGLPGTSEGTVIDVTDDDGWPVVVEWDAGFIGAAAAESLALVPPLAR